MTRDARGNGGWLVTTAIITVSLCGAGRLVLSCYSVRAESRNAQAKLQAAEEDARNQRAWNERLYRATAEAVLHPTPVAFGNLAREFPGGTGEFGYRMVYLYATLDNPFSRHADRLQAWQRYSQTMDNDAWNIQEVLRTTHPRMENWIRALRLNLRDPRIPRGVQEALLDAYTLGGPRPERMVEQHR